MHSPFESHFVQAGDLNIHLMKEGHGEPMILLHGWLQTSYEWHHQIRFLSRRDDRLAHGGATTGLP